MKILLALLLLIPNLSLGELLDLDDCYFLDMQIDLNTKAWQETRLPPDDLSNYLETKAFSELSASKAADLITIYNYYCKKYLKDK